MCAEYPNGSELPVATVWEETVTEMLLSLVTTNNHKEKTQSGSAASECDDVVEPCVEELPVNGDCSDYESVNVAPISPAPCMPSTPDSSGPCDEDAVTASLQHSFENSPAKSSPGCSAIHGDFFPVCNDYPAFNRKDIDSISEPCYNLNGGHSDGWESMTSNGDNNLLFDSRMAISCTL